MSKKRKMVKLKLPSIKVGNGKFITLFEVGNLDHGVYPTQAQLNDLRDAIVSATKNDHSSIFVPAGLVRVTQYSL